MAWETKNVYTQPQFEDSFNGALQLVQTGKNELAYDAQNNEVKSIYELANYLLNTYILTSYFLQS